MQKEKKKRILVCFVEQHAKNKRNYFCENSALLRRLLKKKVKKFGRVSLSILMLFVSLDHYFYWTDCTTLRLRLLEKRCYCQALLPSQMLCICTKKIEISKEGQKRKTSKTKRTLFEQPTSSSVHFFIFASQLFSSIPPFRIFIFRPIDS